ncbi:MAG: apolipoprotein N-acyltransferase [Halioglobus sp.]|jgi:apolipoprotein N-acyltransferase
MQQTEPRLNPLLVLILAPLAGAMVTASLAPIDIWPAGILSCVIYAYLLSTCTTSTAMWRGWLYGLGMFGTGISWVYVSIQVHGHTSVPFAIVLTALFCAALALLHALFAGCYVRFVRSLPGGMLIGFPALWVIFEWVRDWFLTGFPWLYLGYAHVDTWISGWAPITGVFGLSFICALTGTCIFLGLRSRQLISVTTYAVVVITLWGGGAILTPIQWVARASEQPLHIAIVQPNVAQEHKWDPEQYRPIIRQLRELTEPLMGKDIVIWPESAIPNYLQRAHGFLDLIAEPAADAKTTVITGIPFRPEGSKEYFNSITAIGYGEGVYLKQRLVPFGEYLPLENLLRGLIDFFDLPMSSFSSGPDNQKPLRAGPYRVAPFICYEIVYGNLVASSSRNTDVIITISNDSWFGKSIGPLQHLQIAQMRGRENGRYVLRATNNGVSAIIDHQGRILKRTDQFVEEVLIGEAEVMLGHTPFGSFGTMPIIAACFGTLLLMALMYVGFWRDSE